MRSNGGGDRKSRGRIPNALHFKHRPGLDASLNDEEADLSGDPGAAVEPDPVPEPAERDENNDPAERSFHIGPEDEIDGLEDPYDNPDDNGSDGNNGQNNHEEPYNSDADSMDDTDDDGNNRVENDEDGNNHGEDDQDGNNPENVSIESIGAPVVIDSAFLNGKILFLPVTDGSREPAFCAICHSIADEDSEIITALLENRLRLNPILSDADESFGIAFDFFNNNADFQLVCSECLMTSSQSEEGQTVYPKVFSLDFHKRCGNLSVDHPDNIGDLFNQTGSTISFECVRELRGRILEMEKQIA